MDGSAAFSSEVDRARLAAVESMTVLAGVSSACAIARDGGSFPAYKFHEGRAAALSVVARALRRGEPDLAEVMAALRQQWTAEVERRAAQSRDWQAYAAGGLDAVTELESLLAAREVAGADAQGFRTRTRTPHAVATATSPSQR